MRLAKIPKKQKVVFKSVVMLMRLNFEPKCMLLSKNANFCIGSCDNGRVLMTSQSETTDHLETTV